MEENKSTILIVDDLVENRKLLQDYTLVLGYESTTANDGEEALAKVKEAPVDLVLLDMMMPKMGGLETLKHLKDDGKTRHIPVIMVSALDEVDKVVQCIKIGAVDYLPKPFNPTLLKARIESALAAKKLHDREEGYRRKIENYNVQLESEVWKRTEELSQVRQRVIHRLGRASEYRDNQTGLHVIRMSHYCSKLGAALGWDKKQCDLIFHASPMHDVGKIGIPDTILLKPDKLDHEEWEIMKTHSTIGAAILRGGESELELMAERIAMSHHEKWDGTGYPNGLEGNEIPLE
jgi:putative two-component system response regulator